MRTMLAFLCCTASLATIANDLCGNADARVCLTNSTGFQVQSNDAFRVGTSIILAVPGIDPSAQDGTDAATVPYRLSALGTVIDDDGGVWSDAQILREDARGVLAISFRLNEGTLFNPVIEVRDIEVCQKVSDGPGTVELSISLRQVTKQKQAWVWSQSRKMSTFEPCTQWLSLLPMSEGQVFALNPHDTDVSVTIDDQTLTLGARMRLELPAGAHTTVNAAQPLAMVLAGGTQDLEVVALKNTQSQQWLAPHVARNTDYWSNQWMFANGANAWLTWRRNDLTLAEQFQTGRHAQNLDKLATLGDDATWLRLDSSQPVNGFIRFGRRDGGGSAWVSALPDTEGRTELIMPHIARDTANFWTGLSLSNPNEESAAINLIAYDDVGQELVREALILEPGQSHVDLIEGDRLAGLTQQTSWLRIIADTPITGLALVGNRSNAFFAGYLLPDRTASKLVFPHLNVGDDRWTGLSIINAGETTQSFDITYYAANGAWVADEQKALVAGQKHLELAPENAAYAIVTGQDLVGFALLGEFTTSRSAAYAGQVVE